MNLFSNALLTKICCNRQLLSYSCFFLRAVFGIKATVVRRKIQPNKIPIHNDLIKLIFNLITLPKKFYKDIL